MDNRCALRLLRHHVLVALFLLFAAVEWAGAAEVAGVQHGSAVSSGNGTVTVPITAVDPTKSFLMFSSRHSNNRPVGSMVRGRLASPTSLEFVRVTDETAPPSTINLISQSSSSGASVSGLTWSHTAGSGGNRKLIVGVSVEQPSPGSETVSSVTFDGVSLTFVQGVTIFTNHVQRVELWYLDEADIPTTGSGTMVVTMPGSTREMNAGAITLSGVLAGPPEATATNTNANTASITTGITTLTDGAWLVDVVGSGNSGGFSPGGGQTERWDRSNFTATGASSTKVAPTAGPDSMTHTHSTTSNRHAHLVASFAPAPGSSPIDIDIEWSVVEFSTGVNVQRGSVNQTAAIFSVPISPVASLSQAFVTWSKTPGAADGAWNSDDPILGLLTATNNLLFAAWGANANHTIWWQVIEFTDPADINVQRGATSLNGSALTVDVPLGIPVDPNRTFVLTGYRSSGSGSDVGERMLRAQLINGSTIRFDRSIAGDNLENIIWQVVELNDGSTVQRGSANFPTGVAQTNVPISPVDTTRSVAFASVQPVGGQNMGRTPYAGDDIIGVGSATLDLSASQVVMERRNTVASADVGWFVVEFNAAPVAPSVTHFVIGHDNYGINCVAENVSVVAMDAGNNPVTSYNGVITLDTQTGRGTWSLVTGNGSLVEVTPNDGVATYAFDPADNGAAVFNLSYTEGPSPFNILVSDSSAVDDDTEGNLLFGPSGFTVTANPLSNPPPAVINDPIANQIAGTDFALNIAAFGQTPTDPTCGVIESYAGSRDLKFWVGYSNPALGSIVPTVDTNPISASEAASSIQGVIFTNGQASVTAKYKDVGRIQIFMKDDTVPDPDLPNGIRGASNPFVVRPQRFELTNIVDAGGNPNLGAMDSSGLVFTAAGAPFSVTVTALDAEGDPTPNYGQESVAETVLLTPNLVDPAGNNPPIAAPIGFGPFVNGVATGNDFSWPEVGIITLTPSVGDGDYLGAGDVSGSTTTNVGRFIPDHLTASINSPLFATACAAGSFTYLGESFDYAIAPVATITARAVGGAATQNYAGAYFKITNTSLNNRAYTPASGSLDTSDLPPTSADPAIVDLGGGVGTLTFSAGAGLRFDRGAPTAPIDADIQVSIEVIDADGVNALGNPVTFGNPGGIGFDGGREMRYGRVSLSNSFGSELVDLSLPMRAEYFFDAATGFIANTDDTCSAGVSLTLGPYAPNLSLGDTCVIDSGSPGDSGAGCAAPGPAAQRYREPPLGGDFNLFLLAPGATNDGSVTVTADVPDWLEFDWDALTPGLEDPSGTATFGIFQGESRQIYIREIY